MDDEQKKVPDTFFELDRRWSDLNAAERVRLAELRMLDALLEQVYTPDASALEARVQRVLAGIDASRLHVADTQTIEVGRADAGRSTTRLQARRRWLYWAPAAIAATLLISTGWWAFSPRGSAFAAAEKAYDASLESVDRQYGVTIARNGPLGLLAPVEATLYVRGASRFALKHPGAVPGDFWFGSNGQQSWFVPVQGPVLVSDNPRWLRERVEQEKVSLPFLQLSTILKRLGDRYELENLPSETLPGQGEILWQRIRGTRRAKPAQDESTAPATASTTRQRFPQTVEVWVHPHSGVAGKVVLTWDLELLKPSPRRIELQLTSEQRQPDDWYDYESHCLPPRAVQHVE